MSLSVTELTKSFGSLTLLDRITLQCDKGEILGIFGRNGSGKSTLLKILFGTVRADNIRLTINGKHMPVAEVIPQQLIGYLPQEPFLPKSYKVRDVVPMYFESGEMQDKILYDPLITKISGTRTGNLSLGELRYLELLLVGNLSHPYLMLDEPFAMIEPQYKDRIKEYLEGLKEKKGVLLTDHYYADIFSISNRNLLLKNGRLIAVETQQDLANYGYLPSSAI